MEKLKMTKREILFTIAGFVLGFLAGASGMFKAERLERVEAQASINDSRAPATDGLDEAAQGVR